MSRLHQVMLRDDGGAMQLVIAGNNRPSNPIKLFGVSLYAGIDGVKCLELAETPSAVNHLKVTNAATTSAVKISSAGGDTSVDLTITVKGLGNINLLSGKNISLMAGMSNNDLISLGAYDLDGGVYKNMIAVTSSNTPSIMIAPTTAEKVGFFGTTPVVQQAKANFNNWTAATDVAGALAALGLVDAA